MSAEPEYVTEIWSPPADDGRHRLFRPMPESEPVPDLDLDDGFALEITLDLELDTGR